MTGGKIGDRLMAEAETNLAINVIPGLSESYEVQGRGELQLGESILSFFFPYFLFSVEIVKCLIFLLKIFDQFISKFVLCLNSCILFQVF